MSNVRVSRMVTPNAMPAYCYQVSVPGDGVVAIDLRKSVFTGIVIVSGTNTVFEMFVVRVAASPTITPMLAACADLETAISELTGTTGTDAKVTIGVQAGVLYPPHCSSVGNHQTYSRWIE